MKKLLIIFITILTIIICQGFKVDDEIKEIENKVFSIKYLSTNEKKFKTETIDNCGEGLIKSYMDYRSVNSPSSKQYRFIRDYMEVDEETGFLYDKDGFIGAALGAYYGVIGDRFYFTLESGVVLPIVKIDSKADKDTDANNCYHPGDSSVIEFVIDKNIANEFYGEYGNGLVLSGNYGNYPLFKGAIVKVEKVLEDTNNNHLTYDTYSANNNEDTSIYYYASGY